jgi:hypothetical protein
MREMFKHEDFRYGYEIVLGSAYRGYADVGEALSTAGRVKDGDADAWTGRFSKSTRATLHFRGEPYGVPGDSRFDLYQEVMKYRLGDEVRDVVTPILITEPEDEQFWPGQSQALYDLLPGTRQLVKFTAAEGANRHCEPMGLATRDARAFDWLDRYLETPGGG